MKTLKLILKIIGVLATIAVILFLFKDKIQQCCQGRTEEDDSSAGV